MKTFYKLSPEAIESMSKVEKALELLEEANLTTDIDTTELERNLEDNDLWYLFQQYGDQEFCDHDHLDRMIDYWSLYTSNLIIETFIKDPTQI